MRNLGLLMIPAALIVAGLVACSAPTVPSGLDGTGQGSNDINAGGDDSNDLDTTPTQTTQGSAIDAAPPPAQTADAGNADASAAPDTSTTTTTPLPNGSTCTTDAQCQGKFCLPFKDKGLRCTSACSRDSDCPSNSCNDTPQVCDI